MFKITAIFPLKNTIEITLKSGEILYYTPKFQPVQMLDPIQLVETINKLIKNRSKK